MTITDHVPTSHTDDSPRPDFTYPRRDSSEWTQLTAGIVLSGCLIYGDVEEVEAFHDWLVMNDSRLLAASAPVPPNLSVQASFDWRIAHWGVPTEADITSIDRCDPDDFDPDTAGIDLFFNTQWNHPQEGLVALSLRFPELTFVNCWDCVDSDTGRWFSYEYEVWNGEVQDCGEMECDEGSGWGEPA